MIKEALWVDGWDRGMDGMVIIGHRSNNNELRLKY